DESAIDGGDNFVFELSAGLKNSRYLVLVLSRHSARPWVEQEWTSFMVRNGPGRIQVVAIESAEVPAILASFQRFDARDRDAVAVARDLARVIGRPGEFRKGDTRRLVIGQDLVFGLGREGDGLTVTDPEGRTRQEVPPWQDSTRFTVARLGFTRLSRAAVTAEGERAELIRHATDLGEILFDLLFDEAGRQLLARAAIPGRPRPLITVVSDDDALLSLPWELIANDGAFLVREGKVDLARSTPGEVGAEALLGEPVDHFKLVVNVSAPRGSGLDYEGE
ncbi:MAG: TIR domain-containing protein, partial [bacterium]|nr:TIR domain-containing protein [bacterium]